MKQKRLNDKEKKRLIADKRNGMKDADIARKYGCSTSTVSVIARAAGLTRPARKQDETLQELLDRWDESMPEIRKQCGFKTNTQRNEPKKTGTKKGSCLNDEHKTNQQKKYGISKNRFREVYYHCLQYQEWVDELKYLTDTVKAIEHGKEGKGSSPSGSATESLAIRRIELREKCETIEQTAIEADAEIYQYIIEGVTKEYATYRYLRDTLGMPCGKKLYYDRRRKFYYLLSNKI